MECPAGIVWNLQASGKEFTEKVRLAIKSGYLSPGEHLAHLISGDISCDLTVHETLALPFYHPVIEDGLRTAIRDAAQQVEPPANLLKVIRCKETPIRGQAIRVGISIIFYEVAVVLRVRTIVKVENLFLSISVPKNASGINNDPVLYIIERYT